MIINKIVYSIYLVLVFISYSQLLQVGYLKKYINDFCINIFDVFSTVYSKGYNSNIYYSGDLITSSKDKIDIFIGNHFNYIDFIIHIGLYNKLSNKQFTLMYSKYIENLPLISRIFKYHASLALNKRIDLDLDNIRDFIKKNNNIVIFLYPEGTRINNKKLIKSKEYSKNNNYPEYNNLLFPKMKGMFTIINELAKQNKLGNIIDLTAKVENTTKNDSKIASYLTKNLGNTYVKINIYKCEHIKDYDKFKKWFLQIWDRKEEYLNEYNNFEKYNYKKLDTKLKTSVKILTVLSIFIFCYFVYFIYFKYLCKIRISTIIC